MGSKRTLNVNELVYCIAKKHEKLTRKDIAKAERNGNGVLKSTAQCRDPTPMSSQNSETASKRKEVGPPM